jgi:hypothetical protein
MAAQGVAFPPTFFEPDGGTLRPAFAAAYGSHQ